MPPSNITIRDANNAPRSIPSPADFGAADSAGSKPVVGATDQFGTAADAPWSGEGAGTIIGILKAAWAKFEAVRVLLATPLVTNTRPAIGEIVDALVATLTTGGASETLFEADAGRHTVVVVNPSVSDSLWLAPNDASAAAHTSGSVEIVAGGSAVWEGAIAATKFAVTGAFTGQPITAWGEK